MSKIRTVLVANRGEIACRIMRTARARGIQTVAVYSDADENALHVRTADKALHIGGAAAAESYLDIEKVIGAAKASGADAIHPGYGFLSERAAFAEACEEHGITFIGPSASAIAAMGDKAESKRRMIEAGVPTIPGYQDEDQSFAALKGAADSIGYPVMLKASAGGGGRGQRIVTSPDQLEAEIESAKRESLSSFGDDRLIVEKAIIGARHVEVQVMGDAHGNIIHFGERDCSLQRRRQKVIEEAPSPVISPEIRERMGEAAVEAARAVDYRNAGTVEFLYDPASAEFYFLEMNTRLQVEHPVTELVADVDLVSLQFDAAEGLELPIAQSDVDLKNWAIEARLYAEDPSNSFMPQTGKILRLKWPQDPDVRVDAGVGEGDTVSAHYDPMIAKVIAKGETRDQARERLAHYLEQMTLLGLTMNASFLVRLLQDDTFANGEADTGYVERELEQLIDHIDGISAKQAALVAAASIDWSHGVLSGFSSRGNAGFPMRLLVDGEIQTAAISLNRNKQTATIDDDTAEILIVDYDGELLRYKESDITTSATVVREGDIVYLQADGRSISIEDVTFAPAEAGGGAGDSVRAPMAGLVTSIAVDVDAKVKKGETLATIEAMKMEHRLTAPRDGVVASIATAVGDQVAIRAVLIELQPEN
ncbi:MAG: biotin carboxylase N-terminal domain-containing protein [Pseudomonadota bacterium]